MILEPTVLVLGAGASIPYGYPSGPDLLKEILTFTKSRDKMAVFSTLGYSEKKVQNFIEALDLANPSSIDAFLEYRDGFMEIGKVSIALALIDKEDPAKLKNDWYQHLTNSLMCPLSQFGKNQLKIITFNYDRSLDYFLFNTVKHRYNLSDEDTNKIIQSVPILHLHGKLSYLPWEKSAFTRHYQRDIDHTYLLSKNLSINIIYEDKKSQQKRFAKAKDYLVWAKFIYFLGNRYHPQNMSRIGLENLDTTGITVLGTTYSLTEMERENVMKSTWTKINLRPHISNQGILEFLRNNVTLQ